MKRILGIGALILVFLIGHSQQTDTPTTNKGIAPMASVDSSANAQKLKIYGKVTDESTGKPMDGVSIQVKGTTMGAITDSLGKYELWVPKGTHNIDVSFLGYGSRTLTATVYEKDKKMDIELTQEGKELDIIVVTGNKTGKKLTQEVASVAVLPGSVITQSSAKMDEAINKIPGINMLGKTISIRGGSGFSDATGNRVLGLLDEVPIISPENGSILWDMVPIEAIDQVEIIKGSSSALYGSSALNGVINFRTINPQPEAVNKVLINYGFYDQPRQQTWDWWWHRNVIKKNGDTVNRVVHPMFGGGQFLHAKKYGDFGVVLSGAYNQDQGFRMSNDYKRVRMNTKLRYIPHKIKNLIVGLNMGFFHETLKDFFASRGIGKNMYIPTEVTNTLSRTFNIDPNLSYYDNKQGKHSLKFRVFNSLYYSTTGDSTESTQFYYDYTYSKKFNKINLSVVAGTNGFYSISRGKTFGDLVADIHSIKYFNTRDIINFGAFVQVEKTFFKKRPLILSGGLRTEFAQLAGDIVYNRLPLINALNRLSNKANNITSPVTPLFRFGFNWQAAQGTFLRGSFGQGFRYPALSEKYVYTIRSGAQVFPNPDLRPENGWSAELGIKQGVKISNWVAYFDACGFVMRYHDMIDFQLYSHVPDSIGGQPLTIYGIPFQAVNVVNARIMGVELSALAKGKIFGVPLTFIMGYTYLDPENLDYDPTDPNSTKILKYRIQHSFKADIQTTYKSTILGVNMFYNSFMKEIDNVGIGALGVVSAFRKLHPHGDFVMDIRAGYSYKEKFTFTFIVKNVLNTEYMLRPALIEAPRNYTFQVGYNF